MGRLTYATPPRAKPWIDEAARECVRRGAQHAAALAGVFFAGGCVAVKTMVRLNGVYGDEFFAMLLFLVSFVSLAVWFVLFTIWLIATIAARKRKRTLAATAAWQSIPPENPAP